MSSLLSVAVNDDAREIEVKSRVLFQEDKVSCNPLVRGDSRGQWYILNTVLYPGLDGLARSMSCLRDSLGDYNAD